MSALPPKADMDQHGRDVRVVPLADFGSVQHSGLSPCFGEWQKEPAVRPRPNYHARTLC